jgi:DNA helicase-2/ATP-dependent DNA helicase PcrA
VILVDEYQDLNRCDLEAVRMIAARTGADVFAAGDDDQSIYSFRQAAPAGIRSFDADYPGSSKLLLKQCMRCGQDIVRLANWLIEQEIDREPKELVSVTAWDGAVEFVRFANQEAEAAALARAIERSVEAGIAPERILVLAKSDASGKVFTDIAGKLEALNQKIYLPRGRKGPDPNELQMLVSYMVLASVLADEDRVDDLALRTLLELEENGIGGTRIARVVQYALDKQQRFSAAVDACQLGVVQGVGMQSVAEAARRILTTASSIAPLDDEAFDDWLVRVTESISAPADVFQFVLEVSRSLRGEVADLEVETGDVVVESGSDLVEEISLKPADYVPSLLSAIAGISDTQPASVPDSVTFTTMHGAKGLTADVVFVLQAEEEVIPGAATGGDLDEARRLLYVSLTRARKVLVVGACLRRTGPQRFVGDQDVPDRHFTRFLHDYPVTALTGGELIPRIEALASNASAGPD